MGTGTIVTWIAVGLVAGWLASQFMRGSYGLLGDIVLGVVGAIVASYIGGLILGRDLIAAGFTLQTVVVALVGAAVLLAAERLYARRRRLAVFGRGGS
jgi:uncharacterized membrane protein YeaQ/YmgE (transglycosylase-associated protein family)